MGMGLDLFQVAARFQVGHDRLSGLVPVQPGIPAAIRSHVGGFVQAFHNGQPVALAHLKVVGVVGRGNLHHTGAKIHVHIGIGHNGDLFVHQRQQHLFALQVPVALVVRVNGHRRVPQHGLGPGGGKHQAFVCTHNGVFQVPEKALLVLILHLGV